MNDDRIIQLFEASAQEYDAWFDRNSWAYESEILALKEFLAPHLRGLEIGVGTGRFAVPLGIQMGVEPAAAMAVKAQDAGSRCIGPLRKPCRFGATPSIW